MSDPHPARLNERDDKREVKRVDKREERREDKRSFLQKLAEFLHPGPDSKDELIETLAEAEDNEIINAQSRFTPSSTVSYTHLTLPTILRV